MESFEEQLERLSKDFVWLEDYEVSNLPDEERWSYINKRKLIWDTNAMCRIIETARKDAREKVRREREEKTEREKFEMKREFVENGLLDTDLTIAQLVKVLKVSEEFVLEVKKELDEKK